jgi:hypothetical protein
MSERFDAFAKSLSSRLSRRRMLSRLGAGIVGAVAAVTATGAAGSSNSAKAFSLQFNSTQSTGRQPAQSIVFPPPSGPGGSVEYRVRPTVFQPRFNSWAPIKGNQTIVH